MTEKSVLTKSGPTAGTRPAFPNWPGGGATKQFGLICCSLVWPALGAKQLGARSGRFQLFALPPAENAAPDWLTVSIRGTGNPEAILSMTVNWKPPRMVLVTLFQLLPNCFPRP